MRKPGERADRELFWLKRSLVALPPSGLLERGATPRGGNANPRREGGDPGGELGTHKRN